MPRYVVTAAVIGSKVLGEYEADSEEEAIEKAGKEAGIPSICHQCSGEIDDPDFGEFEAEQVEERKANGKR